MCTELWDFVLLFRHILKHPLVKLFIALKWKRFNKLYLLNLLFSVIMVSGLSAYILLLFSVKFIDSGGMAGKEVCPESFISSNSSSSKGEYISNSTFVWENLCTLRCFCLWLYSKIKRLLQEIYQINHHWRSMYCGTLWRSFFQFSYSGKLLRSGCHVLHISVA